MKIVDKWKNTFKTLFSADQPASDRQDLEAFNDSSANLSTDDTHRYHPSRLGGRQKRRHRRQESKQGLLTRLLEAYPKLALLRRIVPDRESWVRRFWRRYHVGKILLLLGAIFGLVVGSYLFYLAKTAKVEDLQAALKATTLIYDQKRGSSG